MNKKNRVIIVHQLVPILIKKENWVYIGSKFLSMRNWKKKLGGKEKIKLTENFKAQFYESKDEYLKWLNNQRELNNDSFTWWMSHFAGKNNMVSKFYETICQIKALKKTINNKNDFKNTIVVCEDFFIGWTINANFKNEIAVNYSLSFFLGSIIDFSIRFIKIPFGLIRELLRIIINHLEAMKTFKLQTNESKDEAVLIHRCIDNNSFNDYDIEDRYFTILPKWLEQRGHNVISLPWLYNVNLPTRSSFKALRQNNFLIIEDFLNYIDYFKAFKLYFLAIFPKINSKEYPELNVKMLILKERFLQASSFDNYKFFTYKYALKKWSKNYKKITVFDVFEMMPPEHVLFTPFRNGLKQKSIGYYHSIVSKDYTGYWFHNKEIKSKYIPDLIITNGKLGKHLLTKQGLDPDKIILGPALRQKFLFVKKSSKKNDILLLCSFDYDSALEAIFKLDKALSKVQTDINVTVKGHPMMDRKHIINHLNDKKLPNNWSWSDNEIHDDLNTHLYCVVLGSASIIDAVLNDCIVFPVQREFQRMGNFLDSLEDKFPIIKEISEEKLNEKIEDAIFFKKPYYIDEFKKIKSYLLSNLNEISTETLKVFEKNLVK